jgi:hypothetical protein
MSRYVAIATTCLRTSLLVLLVLGVMVRPVFNQVGQLHSAEHAALASDTGAADHDPGTPDPDHATGSHGLMHMADTGASFWIFTSEAFTSTPPPDFAPLVRNAPPLQLQRLASPFRPPIA